MTIFGGVLLYLSLLGLAVGFLSVLIPLRFLGVRSRKRGLLVCGVSFALFAVGVYLPVSETRVALPRTHLDEFIPAYQFSEFHSIDIRASKEQVDAAIREVSPDEIRFFQTLTWLRRFGQPSGPGILNAPGRRPILETFTNGAFMVLADDPGCEIVFGRGGHPYRRQSLTAEEYRLPHAAPLVKIAMNFRIQEMDAAHCRLTTETRVFADGFNVVHGFAAYWRMIYPGSSLIRRGWLRAIKLRAEEDPQKLLRSFNR